MSTWTALNVKYAGEYEMPEAFLSTVSVRNHPGDGFDVILDVHRRGDRVESHILQMAKTGGEIDCCVVVSGSDTSDMFTFTQVDNNGAEINRWSDREDLMRDKRVYERIEEDIGLRPDYGGNYRGYSQK